MSTQSCTPCAAGSYSLGSGLRFDQWDALPAGFISIASFLNAKPPNGDFQACSKYAAFSFSAAGGKNTRDMLESRRGSE